MRLFVALELPEAQRHALAELRRRPGWLGPDAGNLGWVPRENLHVTLSFLGEVADGRVADVCRALGEIRAPGPLNLHTEGVTFFPPRGPVRVFVSRLGGDVGRLVELHDEVECALAPLGFPRERRAYAPHVTLARARRDRPARGDLRELVATHSPPPPGDPFRVESFALMRSDLKPTGAIYTPVARFSLGG
jgi:2'-5' RNA ligase